VLSCGCSTEGRGIKMTSDLEAQVKQLEQEVLRLTAEVSIEQSLVNVLMKHMHLNGWLAASTPDRLRIDPVSREDAPEALMRKLHDERLHRLSAFLNS
jgi:hypothetical protein